MRDLKYFIFHPGDLSASIIKKIGRFLPDALYLKLRYRLEMKRKLHLNIPKTFTEKIQWLKISHRHPEQTRMVDKYAVKKFVTERIGEKFIIPTFGIWNCFEDIDFDILPEQFVLKTTHGGGNTGVVVVKDKNKLNKDKAKKQLDWSMTRNDFAVNREWPYKNVPRKIIAEEFLTDGFSNDLADYKWFCFNGEPKYCQVIRDRNTTETIDFYDTKWHRQEFIGLNPNVKNGATPVPCPHNLTQMIEIAKELSKGYPFLRVDLYEVNQRIYFGELTFFPASGFGKFTPEEWDLKLGELITLPM